MTTAKPTRHETGIQWTHVPGYIGATWNPTTGCTRVSPGCERCYAFTLHDQRYVKNRDHARAAVDFGSAQISDADRIAFVRERESVHGMPFPKQYDKPFSTVQLLDDARLMEPLRKRAPHAYFVDSMADLFHEDVPFDFIDRVFAVMALTPRHLYQVLTKRPERMRAYFEDIQTSNRVGDALAALSDECDRRGIPNEHPGWGFDRRGIRWEPLENVWLGTSTENNPTLRDRVEHLRETPAAVRFLSCEPLLEDISAEMQLALGWYGPRYPRSEIDMVIVGGESGPRSRPFDIAWARALRDQCAAGGVAFFLKQLGSRPYVIDPETGEDWPLRANGHWSRAEEWPEDLRDCRAFPEPFGGAL